MRHPQLEGEALGVVALGADRRVGDPPRTVKSSPETMTGRPSTSATPNTKLDGVKPISSPASSYCADAGDRADLVERARVDEMLDALAHRELAELVLTGDLLGTAHGLGHLGAATELVELGLPSHASSESARRRNASAALEDQLDVGSAAEEVVGTRDRIELDGSTDTLQRLLQAQRLVERHPGVGFAVLDEDRWRIRSHVRDGARGAGELEVLPDRTTEEMRLEVVGRLEVEREEVAHRVPDDRGAHPGRRRHQRGKRRERAARRCTPQVRPLRFDADLGCVVVQPTHRVDHVVELRRELRLTAEAVAHRRDDEAGGAEPLEEAVAPVPRLARRSTVPDPPPAPVHEHDERRRRLARPHVAVQVELERAEAFSLCEHDGLVDIEHGLPQYGGAHSQAGEPGREGALRRRGLERADHADLREVP